VRLRQAVRGVGFFGLTLGYGTGVYLGVSRAHGDLAKRAARDEWASGWARALLRLFDVEMVVTGDAGQGNDARGRVVVANHRSIIDIAVLLSIFGGALVSRADLEKWPIVGPAARSAGTIFVDRGSKKSGAQAIQAMVDRLEEHDTVCLFPEGTTYEDDPVRPFKPGACVAAARANVPVIPVAIVYPRDSGAAFGGETFMTHLARLADARATVVHVEIGAPMEPAEGEAVDAFTERCRAEVARLVGVGREKSGRA
jgi:1-acyl-sn-glycerol-3-phosphate acyltransferase